MMNNLKIAAVGGLAALGLASAAAAQQTGAQTPTMPAGQHQQMMSGGMQNGQTMADPQMRQQMMQMVQGCNKMMQQMPNMPHSDSPTAG